MTSLQQLLRAVVLSDPQGSNVTVSWPKPCSQSDVDKRCNSVMCNQERVQTLVFELAPGIRVTVPMTKADLDFEITVMSDPSSGSQRVSRRPILGPRSQMGTMWNGLFERDMAARTAVVCHAFGDEMPAQCEDCGDSPFGGCVVYRNQSNNACANCIFTGREKLCEWRTRYDLDSDEEHDYVPPKTRGAGRTRRSAPKRRAEGPDDKGHSPPSKRRRCLTAEPDDDDGLKLSAFIDLTAENELMAK